MGTLVTIGGPAYESIEEEEAHLGVVFDGRARTALIYTPDGQTWKLKARDIEVLAFTGMMPYVRLSVPLTVLEGSSLPLEDASPAAQ